MNRSAILVLGMHRSGTSALTGMLVRLGAAAPRTLLAPARDNPLGFWESSPFRDLHDRLLRAAGTSADLWDGVELSRLAPDVVAGFRAEFTTLLKDQFGSAPLLAVKDPRLCRLVPFWRENLEAAGVVPRIVLMLRRASAVARSLQARDGTSLEHGLLLWLRHMLDAEYATRPLRRVFVRYDELLSDWGAVRDRISRGIDVQFPSSDNANDPIDGFLQPGLRHHDDREVAPVAPLLAGWVTRTEEAFACLSVGGADAADAAGGPRDALDEIRATFEQVSGMFIPVLQAERARPARLERELAETQPYLCSVEAHRVALQQEVAALQHDKTWLRGHADAVEHERARLQERVGQLEIETQRLFERHEWLVRELTAVRSSLSARANRAEQEMQDLRASLSWRLTAPLRAVGRQKT